MKEELESKEDQEKKSEYLSVLLNKNELLLNVDGISVINYVLTVGGSVSKRTKVTINFTNTM